VGDNYSRIVVKLSRQGKLLWQVGEDCSGAPAPKCVSVDWAGSSVHGQQLLDDDHLLLFNNGDGSTMSPVFEYSLTEGPTTLTGTKVWSYVGSGVGSLVLGDVQRLPNGNTLVTYSTGGSMEEVTPSGDIVQSLSGVTFGYSSFRETLYGPPLGASDTPLSPASAVSSRAPALAAPPGSARRRKAPAPPSR
ncbi:MAG TPA: hypothetical protein VH328_13415, partial [Burkholderiaceae bacterium]|nr:hypothetical protein [Burkholderiaceae bacterium]